MVSLHISLKRVGFTDLNRTEFQMKETGKKQFSYIPKWLQWIFAIATLAVYAFVFYYFIVSPSSIRWKGLYGETNPIGYSIRGIDISHYQGNIDWELLKNATLNGEPIRFAIMKATEGTDFLDEYFNYNFDMAREIGLIRGAYHFFLPSESPRLQAEYFIEKVHLQEGDFPPVLDIEHPGNLTPEQIRNAALEWLQIIEERYDIKPIIYTNYKFKKKYLNDSLLNTYPYWIAHYYVDTLEYTGEWKLWQYTDNGKIDGIKGTTDFNIYNGSMYDLQKFLIGHREENDYSALNDNSI
jgi:lysozyme